MEKISDIIRRVAMLSLIFYILSACTFTVFGVSLEEDLLMTGEQLQSLQEFKKMVMPRMEGEQDYMKSDFYLIRWLRANNFNLQAANHMLMENVKWRKQWNIDGIHDEDWSDMFADFPYTNDTHDFDGRPIGTFNFADWDLRKAIASGKQVRLFRYLMKLIDETTQRVFTLQREGKNVTQWKVLINMEGFNLVQHGCASCLPGVPFLVQAYEDHYPGFADAIITINTPAAFQIVINLAKPVLSEHNKKALKVFGFNKEQWMAYLDKEISRDERYPEFGGTRQSKN